MNTMSVNSENESQKIMISEAIAGPSVIEEEQSTNGGPSVSRQQLQPLKSASLEKIDETLTQTAIASSPNETRVQAPTIIPQ